MSFNVPAEAYGRFMGRFSEPLAVEFADLVGIGAGQRVLDVGCGPGALTAVLVELVGAERVVAADPSGQFVDAVRSRLPEVDVRRAGAESLPFADDTFDASLAQLVVHFMTDPVAGLREMARVTRPAGLVGACVWDHAGGQGPLSRFWDTVLDLDPAAPSEADLAGSREGHLAELFTVAGLRDVTAGSLTVSSRFASFEEWWDPYTLGVGPAGEYVAALDPVRRQALRDRCAEVLPEPPFELLASAWTATGTV